jgi:hypothetical protein
MIDQIKRYELETGINLHLIKSNKFKTVLFGVYIKRPPEFCSKLIHRYP